MNKISKYIFTLCFLVYFSASHLWADDGFRWDYSGSGAVRSIEGDSLNIKFSVRPCGKLKPQEVIYIIPSLLSSDGLKKVEMEPVCIAGNRRYIIISRNKKLHNLQPDKPWSGDTKPISQVSEIVINKSVPFEPWMADCRINVEEKVFGCAECEAGEAYGAVKQVKNHIFGKEDYKYDFIVPEKVVTKCYQDDFDCKVNFEWDKDVIKPDFRSNRAELDSLDAFMLKNSNIKGASLKEVRVCGYASPEGDFDYNRALAQRRTDALSAYAKNKYPILSEVSDYISEGKGEDWAGLRDAVERSLIQGKEKIISSIDRYSTDIEREKAIAMIDSGEVYKSLVAYIYPFLRRTTFSLRFNVREYSQEEIAEMFEKNPRCLSHAEMFSLAQKTAAADKDPSKIFEVAYNQFPSDDVAKLNYANALLKYGNDGRKALSVLSEIKDNTYCSKVMYAMAIAYDMQGEWRKAEKLVKKASVTRHVEDK